MNTAGLEKNKLSRLFRIAVVAGVEDAVKLHISRGDPLDARDEHGLTPLMLAATLGRASLCQLLISSGADVTLQDSFGRDALAMAEASGAAADVIAILSAAARSRTEPLNAAIGQPVFHTVESDRQIEVGSDNVSGTGFPRGSLEESGPKTLSMPTPETASSIVSEAMPVPDRGIAVEETVSPLAARVLGDLDLSDWVAETDALPPASDSTIVDDAMLLHSVVAKHETVDTFEDWTEFDVDLPESARPRRIQEDDDQTIALRRLFYFALHEGSVPEAAVNRLCRGESGTFREGAEESVRVSLEAIGVEIDERISLESLEQAVDDDALYGGDIAGALEFMDELSSARNVPMRHYLREMTSARHGSPSLLTGAEEIELGREMEESISGALDALAKWPKGVLILLKAAEQAESSELAVDQEEDPGADGDQSFAETPANLDRLEPDVWSESPDSEAARLDEPSGQPAFGRRMARLADVLRAARLGNTVNSALRDALAQAAIPTSFLMSVLDDATASNDSDAGAECMASMDRHSRAKERMVVSNLRLVMSIAKRYNGRGLAYEDLVQEGNIGLMKAAERYDWRLGFRFSTYATWWIRQSITRAISDTGYAIRIPVHRREALAKAKRLADEFAQKSGRELRLAKFAELLSTTIEKASEWLEIEKPPTSLDELHFEREGEPPAFMHDHTAEAAFLNTDLAHLRKSLDALLDSMPAKQALILRHRFGWDGRGFRTLDELGKLFGVTRERIRQIEAKAFRTLGHVNRSGPLELWLDIDFSQLAEIDRPALPSPSATRLDSDDASENSASAIKVARFPGGLTVERRTLKTQANVADAANGQSKERLSAAQTTGKPQQNDVDMSRSTDKNLDYGLKLAQANNIAVADERVEGAGKVWIRLEKIEGAQNHKLARLLVALGFEYAPGKGFWR